MTIAALPMQGRLTVPINWSGTTAKTTMKAAGYTQSGTLGWRPATQTATLEWKLTPSEAGAIIDTFEATNWNGIFSYVCSVRGEMKLRLTGEYAYEEKTLAGTWIKKVALSVGVERV